MTAFKIGQLVIIKGRQWDTRFIGKKFKITNIKDNIFLEFEQLEEIDYGNSYVGKKWRWFTDEGLEPLKSIREIKIPWL